MAQRRMIGADCCCFDGVIAAERNEGFSGSRGLGVEKWGSDNETNNHGFTLNM